MTSDAVLDSVRLLARAAATEELLSDVDSLSAGITAAGWVRNVNGGQWSREGQPGWSLFSSDHAPGLAVFLSDDDVQVVYACGQELARRLDREEGLRRHGADPGWPDWAREDPRWTDWSGLEADWVTWHGGPARVSLNVRPAYQPGRIVEPPHLHFQIERLDTPSDGLPEDDEHDRLVARTGSSLARWHLAGKMRLPDDVVRALEKDDDPAIVAAVKGYEKFRNADTKWRASLVENEQA
ncbi:MULTISPECIES: hypothetical protein [unclassified Rathayibacter]|uniref:hypothetical protein n=1 Tax=unclassified Rathayibacter TaxID=2609250 RepID=UPI00188BC9F6|nr:MULTISPECIES: hypothetical protein [unclassified Rathayibacter]MBF4463236.1 hypothetical protein [Rathayibacter sp. VKM Ac-2879]MBF4504527.1 hypothetical protein [Rathayibacter sp. VKM Ac-2878]